MKITRYTLAISALLLVGWGTAGFAKENVGKKTQPRINSNAAKVAANCPNTTAQVDLDINQVRARILTGGDLWWDPVGQTPFYEVPIGSNKQALYAGAIWVGGIDKAGQLRVAAQTYRQSANDMWAGPISKDPSSGALGITLEKCLEYDRFWQITRAEVDAFVNEGAEATQSIKDWPGNGNVGNGELPFLAPFFDADNNGVYEYTQGDYPYFLLEGDYPIDPNTNTVMCNDYLFGDKSIWWVFNDVGNIKTETNSAAIGLEVRAQAFAFKTADEVNYMTFYKYQLINRSNDSLTNAYMAVWVDPDLGNASDDFVGCDVGLGLGYVYNGDPDDDGSGGYGTNPPAVGIDFFQGPLADAGDGKDNDRDGVIDEPGEQIIMSGFLYYINVNNVPNGNPFTTDDYYEYMSMYWANGQQVTYGGDGFQLGNPPTNFMFSDGTDPAFPGGTPWNMVTAGIQPDDMRWLQSAGEFTLAPGAVNYVTTGVMFTRTLSGGPLASVSLLKLADQKAQAIFDNCFKILDGPNAPDVAIRELDRKILLTLENANSDKVELYNEVDPTIPTAVPSQTVPGGFDTLTLQERSYQFQGYKVYQVVDETVSDADLNDPAKAKLIAQIDLKDNIGQIVNFNFDNTLNAFVPVEMATVVNNGIYHTVEITQDLFTQGNLVNYKPYYFIVVSYAYNNYRPFDPNNSGFTQYRPYVQGRNNVRVYSAIPHKPEVNNGGTIFQAEFGQGFQVKRIEGTGNGGNVLDLTDATVNEILSSQDHRAYHPVYKAGKAPIDLRVYDPMGVKAGGFRLRFDGVSDDSHWFLYNWSDLVNPVTNSTFPISVNNTQVYEPNKFSIEASKINGGEPGNVGAPQNGFLEATIEFSDPSKAWLTGVPDVDDAPEVPPASSQNWIRSGTASLVDFEISGNYQDSTEAYEGVIGGTWAPYILSAKSFNTGIPAAAPRLDDVLLQNIFWKWSNMASVDVVITADKNLWTRSVVFELAENTQSALAVGNAKKFDKRKQASVDKDGRPYTDPNANQAEATLTNSEGMGWFPGYAINVETGERLNIAFGENSALENENSKDMIWNPTQTIGNDINGNLSFGGGHYIYIFNKSGTTANDIPIYDFGKRIDSLSTLNNTLARRNVHKDIIWVTLPVIREGHSIDEMASSTAKIRLRVAKNYRTFTSIGAPAENGGNPYYEFEVPASYEPQKNVASVGSKALDNIRVVPNPYYAYSTYERTRKDQLDNRIRITNLPSKCTVSIYTLNGTLIRQIKRDVSSDVSSGQAVSEGRDENLATTLDWDLKNTAGITVASGIYIIHVDAGTLGEKVVKWFGVMRPIDLDSF